MAYKIKIYVYFYAIINPLENKKTNGYLPLVFGEGGGMALFHILLTYGVDITQRAFS